MTDHEVKIDFRVSKTGKKYLVKEAKRRKMTLSKLIRYCLHVELGRKVL